MPSGSSERHFSGTGIESLLVKSKNLETGVGEGPQQQGQTFLRKREEVPRSCYFPGSFYPRVTVWQGLPASLGLSLSAAALDIHLILTETFLPCVGLAWELGCQKFTVIQTFSWLQGSSFAKQIRRRNLRDHRKGASLGKHFFLTGC